MNILDLLHKSIELKASDLHITVGYPPVMRINGNLIKNGDDAITPEDSFNIVKQILNNEQMDLLEEKGELDTSYSHAGLGRFRINVFKQRGTCCIAIRMVSLIIPSIQELGLPSVIEDLSMKQRGLVLVTGPTGSGKSTTLASMIKKINNEKSYHIITLEDPIEYLHKHNKSIVNQREIGNDTKSYANALRAALRQDPDVILVGEMRDLETISIAITAAETGHLVLSTLHTIGAASTIDRIIDVFPPHQQQQIRVQLSAVLEGVISQQLIPKTDGTGRTVALEIMTATNAIRNLIREGKNHQIQTVIQTGAKYGMKTMDNSLTNLFNNGVISVDSLLNHAIDKDLIKKHLNMY